MKKRVIVNVEYEIEYDNDKQYKSIIKELKYDPIFSLISTNGSFERKRVLSITDKNINTKTKKK